ncbi:MAG: hypothetical protein JSV08_06120 [Acidobacteriota bacterium]|nr:MAG: hypothetical protein JSV08_06120 [Acidobacteriota bacterium]
MHATSASVNTTAHHTGDFGSPGIVGKNLLKCAHPKRASSRKPFDPHQQKSTAKNPKACPSTTLHMNGIA